MKRQTLLVPNCQTAGMNNILAFSFAFLLYLYCSAAVYHFHFSQRKIRFLIPGTTFA